MSKIRAIKYTGHEPDEAHVAIPSSLQGSWWAREFRGGFYCRILPLPLPYSSLHCLPKNSAQVQPYPMPTPDSLRQKKISRNLGTAPAQPNLCLLHTAHLWHVLPPPGRSVGLGPHCSWTPFLGNPCSSSFFHLLPPLAPALQYWQGLALQPRFCVPRTCSSLACPGSAAAWDRNCCSARWGKASRPPHCCRLFLLQPLGAPAGLPCVYAAITAASGLPTGKPSAGSGQLQQEWPAPARWRGCFPLCWATASVLRRCC